MRRALLVLAAMTLSIGGCGGDDDAATEPMLVLAAASLTDALTDIAAEFEAANEGVTIELSFGASPPWPPRSSRGRRRRCSRLRAEPR